MHEIGNAVAASAAATATAVDCLLHDFPAAAAAADAAAAVIYVVFVFVVVVVFNFIRHLDVERRKNAESLEYRIFSSISNTFYFKYKIAIKPSRGYIAQ